MSNTSVGAVYAQIMADVIDSSRIDFEEMGVEEAVLEELKKGWQSKLSGMSIAQFPWDPKPEPPPPANNPPPPAVSQPPPQAAPTNYVQAQVNLNTPQNAPQQLQQHQQPLSLPGNQMQQQHNSPQIKTNPPPQIKNEPGLPRHDPPIKQEGGAMNNGMPSVSHPGYGAGPPRAGMAVAQARAAQALESQYGQRAAASINALHNGIAQGPTANLGQQYQSQPQHQVQGQPQGQRPGQPQQVQYQQQQQQQQQNAQQAMAYRAQIAQQMAQQQQRAQQQPQYANGQNGIHKSQVDGSSDAYEGVLMQRGADGNTAEMGRLEIDGYLHAQFAARAKQMEGGGLMLPLKEATKAQSLAWKKKRSAVGPSQMDGLSDDEDAIVKDEEDEDAINSDLDDPDDNQEDDDEDDDSMGHLMLCMYDKVQRVKNKWKCTLKDGMVTINGKDYVFHKATGEYEW